MNESVLIVCDAVLVLGMGAWLFCAVHDNWRYPNSSEELVRMVVRMELMEQEYPKDFSKMSHRRLESPVVIKGAFLLILLAETLVAFALLLSGFALLGAAIGLISSGFALSMGMISALLFAQIWIGFIVGGNYFAYWYSHSAAQMKHMVLAFWGILVMIFLSI